MKNYIIHIITSISWIMMSAACSQDSGIPAGQETDFSLKITVNVAGAPSSRATATTDENRIDHLLILLFAPDNDGMPSTLYKVVEASDISGNSTHYIFDARFAVVAGTTPPHLCVVAIANVPGMLDDAIALEGKSYDEVRNNLCLTFAQTPAILSMWGVATDNIDTSLKAQGVNISLIRDRARIDVSIDAEKVTQSLFSLNSIRLLNPSSEISIMPALDAIDGTEAVKPTIPAGKAFDTTPQIWTGADNNAITHLAYTPEADVKMGDNATPDDGNRLKRPALIIGGFYNGSSVETYYRVDLMHEDNLTDILRNHLYRISVTAVNGPGESTPEDAYRAISAAISADIIEWSDLNQDVEIDGSNWIAMQRYISIDAEEGASVDVDLSTNVNPGLWMACKWRDLSEDDDYSGWSDSSSFFSVELPDILDSDNNAHLTITALSALPSDMECRKAQLQINVTSRLQIILNITQQKAVASGNGNQNKKPWEDQDIYGEI